MKENTYAGYTTVNAAGRRSLFNENRWAIDFNFVHFNNAGCKSDVVSIRHLNASKALAADVRAMRELAETKVEFLFTVDQNEGCGGGTTGARVNTFVEPLTYEGENYFPQLTPTGFVLAGTIRGSYTMDSDAVEAMADKARPARVIVTEKESGRKTEYFGLVLTTLDKCRSAMLTRDGDGLNVITIQTGKVGRKEKANQAALGGDLSPEAGAKVRADVLEGNKANTAKSAARNHAKRTAKAVRAAVAGK